MVSLVDMPGFVTGLQMERKLEFPRPFRHHAIVPARRALMRNLISSLVMLVFWIGALQCPATQDPDPTAGLPFRQTPDVPNLDCAPPPGVPAPASRNLEGPKAAGPIAPAATNGPPKPYVTIVWGVTNSGPGAAIGSWNDTLYFSTNSSLDASALEVWSPSEYGPVPAAGRYSQTLVGCDVAPRRSYIWTDLARVKLKLVSGP